VKRIHQDEAGVALITALLAVLILSGLAVVFVSRATAETRASGNSRNHEVAIHTAEAAADVQIAELNALDTHVTRDNSNVEVQGPATGVDENTWARSLLPRMRDSDAWVEGDSGEAYAVRPVDAAGDAVQAIYAVGATPGFAAPNAQIRVIKMQVAQDNFIPRFALLTDGHLKFGGNAAIVHPDCDVAQPETCVADVHVNKGFTNPGNSSTVQGQVRVAGGACPSGVTAVNGCADTDVAPYPIPEFTARSFYMRDLDKLRSDPDPGRLVEWYDLCPNGTVRSPSTAGPCTGGQLWPADDTGNNFRGWDWKPSQNEWSSTNLDSGVFYVYRANASINGSAGVGQRAVSVIVEGGGVSPNRSGNLEIKGNPALQAALPDVLFITDRDLAMSGTASGGSGTECGQDGASYSGVIGVVEQLDVGGTVDLRGAILVRDQTDESNVVQRNNASISGTMCLQYDDNLAIDLTGIWVVTFWNELLGG
jgi:hypothetical protein